MSRRRHRAALVCSIGVRLAALALAISSSSAADGPKNVAPTLSGIWEVVHVAVDRADQPHWLYRPDDPRLLGRELLIDGEHVHFGYGMPDCEQARWKAHSTSWGQLLAQSFPRPESAALPRSPAPSDFGSKLAKSAPVTVQSLNCASADAGRAAHWAEAWFVAQGRNSLTMRVDGSTLLTLARRAADAKPRASFDCAKAITPTEQALCSQTALAGLDRSVAAAWRAALERQSSDAARLRDEQKAWLAERDRCGADADCLETQLQQRVEELVRQ